MNFENLAKILRELSPKQTIQLLKGLYDLSPQNKVWLRCQLLPDCQIDDYLEECRRKIIKAVYEPTRNLPDRPRFREAKKIITEYYKSTQNSRGKLDLMLTYVERGHAFTNDFGDIDEPFYEALINMLGRFAAELQKNPAKKELYEQFRSRLMAIRRTSEFGWGYGDFIDETIDNLESIFNTIQGVNFGIAPGS